MIDKPLLVIIGPTAVGKTALSLELAQKFGGEIISADSRLFYRGMDIGTAKPSPAEQALAPHHLIDICEPDETITLGDFQQHVFTLINTIHQQDKLPLLVGGTGQYVQAVVEGWGIPRVAPQPELRAELADRDKADLYAELETLDPVAAAKIHPNNVRRIIRALEVCIVSGEPISSLQKKQPPPYTILKLGLTCDREKLYTRIDARVDGMMEAGFLTEMEHLRSAGYQRRLPSMSGLGYAQLWEYLDKERSLAAAVQRIKYETHRFVRHQNNWFRSQMKEIEWFDIFDPEYPQSAFLRVEGWLAGT